MRFLSTIYSGVAILLSFTQASPFITRDLSNSSSTSITVTDCMQFCAAENQADVHPKRALLDGGVYSDWVWWDIHHIYESMHLKGRSWSGHNRREMDMVFWDLKQLRAQTPMKAEDFGKESRFINELHNMGREEVVKVWEEAIKDSPNYEKHGDGEPLTDEEREKSIPGYRQNNK